MEFITFLLAACALLWAYKNAHVVRTLEEQQRLLQREIVRLDQQVKKPAPEQPSPEAAPKSPVPAPAPAAPRMPTTPPTPRPLVPPEPPPVHPPARPVTSKAPFDWEALVGVQLFSWIAGIALVMAAIFFLKYSVDHGWLGPPMRVVIGLVTGVSLLLLCEWKVARRYPTTANALDGAGIAILFATFFAAYSFWNLIGAFPTFAMMALVTVVAVLLSLHHDSVFVALLGLVGGFATPALLSTGEDRPIGLFTYLLLLNAGLAWVAYRKRWPHLTVVSAIFTTLYQWGWVMRFMQPGTVPLALVIFMVFPVLTRVALTLGEKGGDGEEPGPLFRHTAAFSVALPLLFAVYMAAVPSYGNRYWLLFGFLLLLDIGLAVIAKKRGPEALHLAGGMGTVVTVWAWLQVSYTSAAWPALPVIVAVFVLFYLATGYWIRFRDMGTRGVFVAPLLLVAFPVLASIEPATANPGLLFAGLFVLMGAIAAFAIVRRDDAVHLLSAVFVLATGIAWSVKHLGDENLVSALFIYTALGLFYLCVPLIYEGVSKFTSGFYLALTGHAFLLFVVLNGSLAIPPWPFLIALAVLDLAIAIAAFYTQRTELHLGALAASQVLLILWQLTVQADPWPGVATVCAVGVAALGVVWFLLGQRKGMLFGAGAVTASFLGLLVLSVALQLQDSPGVAFAAAVCVVLLCFVLLVDRIAEWRWLAPVSSISAAFVLFIWSSRSFASGSWSHEFLFAAAIYALYLGYPLVLGSTLKKSIEPHLAAVLASVTFFLFARHSLLAGGFENIIGLLPVVQAGLMSVLLWRLLKLEPPNERTLGRLALVAGAILAFVTVAIPLQLEKEWITIGWALQAAAIAWLSRRIPHKGLVIWTSGLLAAVFARLVLNPAVLSYHPRSSTPILNWYLYTYLVAAAAFFLAAWFLRGRDRILDGGPGVRALANAGGVMLLFLLLNIEIADYYSVGSSLTFNFGAGLAQDLTYTIGWGLFAFGLLIAGIVLVNKPGRLAAIVLLSATVAKCFLYDLWRLGGLYRVGSFVGLAVCLTMVAVLLQKFVLQSHPGGVKGK
jgi:uncharacterized membrane protein